MGCRDKAWKAATTAGFPGHIAALDRARQGLPFDHEARRHGVFHVVGGQRRYAKAALSDQRYQPFGDKPHQRLAQWTDADTVAGSQLIGAQRRSWRKLSPKNVLSQPMIG